MIKFKNTMKEVVCKEVIITRLLRRGKGVEYDPIRCITQVFDKKGNLIAEHDPNPSVHNDMDIVDFCRWTGENNIPLNKVTPSTVTKWLKEMFYNRISK